MLLLLSKQICSSSSLTPDTNFQALSVPTTISHTKQFGLTQIKGKDFIPPTNLLWLAAMGPRGEIHAWRKPESKSSAPRLCQTVGRMDLLLLEDAPLPSFALLLGGASSGGGRGGGVSGWQRRAGWWYHVPGAGREALGCGRAAGRGACLETRGCVLGSQPREKGAGGGSELQLHQVGRRVGAPLQPANLSKTNKQSKSFKGQKEFMASGQIQQIFLARSGRVLKHHF